MTVQRLIPAALLLILGALPATAATASFSGAWKVSIPMAPVCTLVQKGKTLSGDCKADVLQGPITGSVDGNKVTWNWNAAGGDSGPQGTVTIIFTGQWDTKNAVTGNWTSKNPTGQFRFPPDSRPFTASRAQ